MGQVIESKEARKARIARRKADKRGDGQGLGVYVDFGPVRGQYVRRVQESGRGLRLAESLAAFALSHGEKSVPNFGADRLKLVLAEARRLWTRRKLRHEAKWRRVEARREKRKETGR